MKKASYGLNFTSQESNSFYLNQLNLNPSILLNRGRVNLLIIFYNDIITNIKYTPHIKYQINFEK